MSALHLARPCKLQILPSLKFTYLNTCLQLFVPFYPRLWIFLFSFVKIFLMAWLFYVALIWFAWLPLPMLVLRHSLHCSIFNNLVFHICLMLFSLSFDKILDLHYNHPTLTSVVAAYYIKLESPRLVKHDSLIITIHLYY